MRAPRLLATSLLLLALAPALLAQITEKQALAQLKAANKEQLKLFKQAGKDALSALETALDAMDKDGLGGATPLEAANVVADVVIPFVDSVNFAHASAFYSTVSAAEDTLVALANGADLAGVYAPDYYFGTGGTLDDGRDALDKEAAKLRASALKRIEKSLAKAEKSEGLAFALELRLPTRELATGLTQYGGLGIGQGPSFDVMISVSSLEAGHDGVMLLAGATDESSDQVLVRRMLGADDVSASVPVVNLRFTATFTDLKEGGYAISATQGTAPDTSTSSLGVR
jgi:hypothetical protein